MQQSRWISIGNGIRRNLICRASKQSVKLWTLTPLPFQTLPPSCKGDVRLLPPALHPQAGLHFKVVLALSWRPGPSKRSGSRAGRKVGWKAKSFIRGKANCLRRVLLRVNCHKFDTYIHSPSKRHYVFAAAAHLFAPAYLSRPRQVAQARSSRSCLQQVIPLGKRVLPSHFTSTAHSQAEPAPALIVCSLLTCTTSRFCDIPAHRTHPIV